MCLGVSCTGRGDGACDICGVDGFFVGEREGKGRRGTYLVGIFVWPGWEWGGSLADAFLYVMSYYIVYISIYP
jgi:hypothetical protein